MDVFAIIGSVPIGTRVTAIGLLALVVIWLVFFLIPALRQWWLLRVSLKAIKRIRSEKPIEMISGLERVFKRDNHLGHLWKEYNDSLHYIESNEDGKVGVESIRATVPAEMHFSTQSVVDGRLRTEFFKHFPGIFTGVGIIGTFTGLIQGLRAFQVTDDATKVRESLETLMHNVGEAFLVSAAAIFIAMVVTFAEKLLLAILYRQSDNLAQDIDSRFEAGAGEEYLSRLVQASEDSASQAKILKDALVRELGDLLRELTHAQIDAGKQHQNDVVKALVEHKDSSERSAERLAARIVHGIQEGLKEPLNSIAHSVQSASSDQSASAVRMLQDVMASFSQRLNDLFGGQISGLSELNQQTARSIEEAVGTLHTLVASIESANQRSAETMSQRMADAVERMESRQQAVNDQTEAFVRQLQESLGAAQARTSQKIEESLEALSDRMGQALSALHDAQKQVFEGNQAREHSMAERAGQVVSAMSGSVDAVLQELRAATARMTENVSVLTSTTTGSVDTMNASAETLSIAAQRFASAGEQVTKAMGQVALVATKLSETSGSLTSGSTALQTVVKDYQGQRDAVTKLVESLRQTVDSARKEATLTADILKRMELSAQKLGQAQSHVDEYLDGINEVLAEANNSFAAAVKTTLDRSNTAFHEKLSSAVKLLAASIQEFEVSLASFGSKPIKR